MSKLVLAALVVAAFFWLPAPVVGAPISVFSAPTRTYQNTANSPCIFYGSNQGQPCPQDPETWPTPAGGTGTGNDHTFSLTQDYTGAGFTAFSNLLSSSNGAFILGFDINQANDPQTLTGFTIGFDFANSPVGTYTEYYSFSGSLLVPDLANGVGWADYILAAGCAGTQGTGTIPTCDAPTFPYTAFVIPTGATSAHFTFDFLGNDGADRIFVIPGGTPPTTVPEPASLLLLGTGLMGIGAGVRRRLHK